MEFLLSPGKIFCLVSTLFGLKTTDNFNEFKYLYPNQTISKFPQQNCSFIFVTPAYSYIRSAPIKCSNDGGPGPRHKMKGDPGYSIFSMPVVYGCYLHPLTSSEKQVIVGISGDPLPPFKPPWAEPPSLPPGVRTPPPANRPRRGRPQRNRTSASDSRSEAAPTSRGGCGDHFGLFGAPVRGQAAELVTSAG